jgi:hypothetical protein
MVAPGFLQNPEVRRWLNGVDPLDIFVEIAKAAGLRWARLGKRIFNRSVVECFYGCPVVEICGKVTGFILELLLRDQQLIWAIQAACFIALTVLRDPQVTLKFLRRFDAQLARRRTALAD